MTPAADGRRAWINFSGIQAALEYLPHSREEHHTILAATMPSLPFYGFTLV